MFEERQFKKRFVLGLLPEIQAYFLAQIHFLALLRR